MEPEPTDQSFVGYRRPLSEARFRVSPWTAVLKLGPIFALPVVLIEASAGGTLWEIAVEVLGIGLLIAVVANLFKITISEQGIRTWDGFGMYRWFPWSDVGYQRLVKLPGLQYFRLRSPKWPWAHIVPLDLDRPAEFAGLVLHYLGPDHPFTQACYEAWKLELPQH